jgi:hypothetical protein
MKFLVEVLRTSYSHRTIEVEAETSKEAKEKAVDMAGDFEFSEKGADYEATWVGELEKKEK